MISPASTYSSSSKGFFRGIDAVMQKLSVAVERYASEMYDLFVSLTSEKYFLKDLFTPFPAVEILSRYFGLSERFWLNLQTRYDLELEKDRLAGRLEKEVQV